MARNGMALYKDYYAATGDERLGLFTLAAERFGCRSERLRLVEEDLDSFFKPKRERTITREYLERTRRGVAYARRAYAYVFRRVRS